MVERVANTVMLAASEYDELVTYKEFCFELCQLYCSARGTGKSVKEAMAGIKAAEKALSAGLKENGLPPLKQLREWYVKQAKKRRASHKEATK